MIASDFTFDQMRRSAKNMQELGVLASYFQVEYGLSELEACWDGFVDTSDAFDLTFKNRKHVCLEFANALSEYLEFLGEQIPVSLG